jgi:hypothetical protein
MRGMLASDEEKMRVSEADQRISACLEESLRILNHAAGLSSRYGAAASRHVRKVALKQLLGSQFSKYLWQVEHETQWYKYHPWPEGEKKVEEHVVPLDAVIEYLAQNRTRFPVEDLPRLRRFLVPRLILADVPASFNRLLKPKSAMPNENWHREPTTELDVGTWKLAVWARYGAHCPLPGEVNSPLRPRERK